ncbi:MAG: hypothetical protein R3B49_11075 [Phycisphaerales bacterium]
MNHEQRRERAQRALQACEQELERLVAQHASLQRELRSYLRALVLLRARARALEQREAQGASA